MVTLRARSVVWFAVATCIAAVIVAFTCSPSGAAPGDKNSSFVPVPDCQLIDILASPDTVGQRSRPSRPAEFVVIKVGQPQLPPDPRGCGDTFVTLPDL